MSSEPSSKDAAWAALAAAAKADSSQRIADRFAAEPGRLARLNLDAAGLFLDLSKQPWSRAGFEAALALARAGDIEGHRARLFAGKAVNQTEGRPALHMALRAPDGARFVAFSPDGKLLASFGYGTGISLWDVATGKLRGQLEGGARPRALAFAPGVHVNLVGRSPGRERKLRGRR